jgi:phosphate starvation-inducible PhoH-like protein
LIPILFGVQNENLNLIEKALGVEINSRGNSVYITGEKNTVNTTGKILDALWLKIQQGQEVDKETVESALRFLDGLTIENSGKNSKKSKTRKSNLKQFSEEGVFIKTTKKKIQPRSPLQAAYIETMKDQKMVFATGPAGTGKTYLAVAMAVSMLEAGKVERIILSRPALEAGERIGFLPGEVKEKMDPYLRPLYDALQDMMSAEKLQKRMATDEVEIAPLAFMRGRTLNNAFIILDEAQNTSDMQMKMFLTRLGQDSHMVITGDPSQKDLPYGQKSGLNDATDILHAMDEIGFISFTHKDVVRSSLVSKIIQAYDKNST